MSSKKKSIVTMINRKKSLQKYKKVPKEVVAHTNYAEDLLSITVASNTHLKKDSIKLKCANKEQEK